MSYPIGPLVLDNYKVVIFNWYWHIRMPDLGAVATSFIVWRLIEMVKDKLKEPVLTAFTPNGDYVAILSANGTAEVNTTSYPLPAFDVWYWFSWTIFLFRCRSSTSSLWKSNTFLFFSYMYTSVSEVIEKMKSS